MVAVFLRGLGNVRSPSQRCRSCASTARYRVKSFTHCHVSEYHRSQVCPVLRSGGEIGLQDRTHSNHALIFKVNAEQREGLGLVDL